PLSPYLSLFPYPTLFRSLNIGLVHLRRAGDLARMSDAPTAVLEVFPLSHVPFRAQEQSQLQRLRGKLGKKNLEDCGWSIRHACRSEEHTSELQSRGHLVC